MNNEIKTIVRFVITCVIIVLCIRFFIFLLPYILVVLGVFWLYRTFVSARNKVKKEKETTSYKKVKEKNVIKEAEIVNERNID